MGNWLSQRCLRKANPEASIRFQPFFLGSVIPDITGQGPGQLKLGTWEYLQDDVLPSAHCHQHQDTLAGCSFSEGASKQCIRGGKAQGRSFSFISACSSVLAPYLTHTHFQVQFLGCQDSGWPCCTSLEPDMGRRIPNSHGKIMKEMVHCGSHHSQAGVLNHIRKLAHHSLK